MEYPGWSSLLVNGSAMHNWAMTTTFCAPTAQPWDPRRVVGAPGPAPDDAFLLCWAEGVLRAALRRSPLLDTRAYEIFGQGSRVNNTAIEHASDIDLVLMLHAPPGDWAEFRDDVLAAMGESHLVRMGRRCLNVDDPGSLFGEMVDILVATEHRHYPVPGVDHFEQGVFFRDREGRPIVNFPKQHRRHGDEKDLCTGGRFKEVVRMLKRVRRRAEQERLIVAGSAPSYLLECLLYNVPDHVYRTSSPKRPIAARSRGCSGATATIRPCSPGCPARTRSTGCSGRTPISGRPLRLEESSTSCTRSDVPDGGRNMTWTAAQTTAVIALLGATLTALLTYALNRRAARRERRALAFSEALGVVEDYAEMPYRIRRRPGTPEGRHQLTEEVSRIYSRLAFHQALLDIEAPTVAAAYRQLANEAKAEVGAQMKTAWQKPVRTTDAEMNLENHYDRTRVDLARDHCVATMRAALGQGRFPTMPKRDTMPKHDATPERDATP